MNWSLTWRVVGPVMAVVGTAAGKPVLEALGKAAAKRVEEFIAKFGKPPPGVSDLKKAIDEVLASPHAKVNLWLYIPPKSAGWNRYVMVHGKTPGKNIKKATAAAMLYVAVRGR